MDCLSYDQYERLKERQLKEKQMEKDAKPLPGKFKLGKITQQIVKYPFFRCLGKETFSRDP